MSTEKNNTSEIRENSNLSINDSLDQFIQQWHQEKKSNDPSALEIDYDSEWPSECFIDSELNSQPKEQGKFYPWQPVRQNNQDMFERLSEALEITIHPDIINYYSRYWSYHLSANCEEGELELLQVWNQQDMERLRGNLLGHALDQKKRKLPLSFFFAITFPEEGMLCVNNETGEVWYEMPGKKPLRKIANNLSEFIQRLKP